MFLLKSLGNIVFGAQDGALIELTSGQLFYLNPSATRSPRTLTFRDARAAVRRTSARHQYQLVITRVFEEGEEELEEAAAAVAAANGGKTKSDSDSELFPETEYSFLVDSILLFGVRDPPKPDSRTASKPAATGTGAAAVLPSFVWADTSDETSTCGWEFVPDASCTNDVTVRLFEEIVYVCMFERAHGKPKAEATEEELQSFFSRCRRLATDSCIGAWLPSTIKTPAKNAAALRANQSRLSDSVSSPQPMSTGPTAPSTPSPAGLIGAKSKTAAASTTPGGNTDVIDLTKSTLLPTEIEFPSLPTPIKPQGEPLICVKTQLYIYDVRVDQFILVREKVTAEIVQTGRFMFTLTVRDTAGLRIAQPISSDMCPLFHAVHNSFVWVLLDPAAGTPLYSWSLKFDNATGNDVSPFARFQRVLSSCLYETNNSELFSKVKPEDQDFLMNSLVDEVAMLDDDEREDVMAERERERIEEEQAADNDDDDPENGVSRAKFESGAESSRTSRAEAEKNSLLSVGYRTDRSFVVRGNRIGVFKHTDDDGLEFSTTINNVRRPDGTPLTPAKIMLHKQDSSLLMLTPGDRDKIFRMDLERGRIVDEWKVGEGTQMRDMTPNAKYSQLETTDTFVGIGHNSLFRVDPRLSGVKRVSAETKEYKSITDLRVAATTTQGRVAVASDKGSIRLYDNLGKIAKTELPGFGDPIIGIDSAEDGKFLLATCSTYLMLIDTEVPTNGKLGYDVRMGKEKPAPKRLQLKPEHVAWMGERVSFTPARFDAGTALEKFIVTSTGPYVISWNFRRVKNGHLYDYTIKRYDETVVSDNFKYNNGRSIVVALAEDVEMLSASKLRTPTKSLKSRSNIVNSPY